MGKFYHPIKMEIEGLKIIVYPCLGVERLFSRQEKGCIEEHIKEVYSKNQNLLNRGVYHILILWDDNTDKMTDVWIFDKIESWGSGPLVDVKIFRNFELEQNIGVTAGDGLILLGKEEELRRKSNSLKDYINGERPKLPADIAPEENFYFTEQ